MRGIPNIPRQHGDQLLGADGPSRRLQQQGHQACDADVPDVQPERRRGPAPHGGPEAERGHDREGRGRPCTDRGGGGRGVAVEGADERLLPRGNGAEDAEGQQDRQLPPGRGVVARDVRGGEGAVGGGAGRRVDEGGVQHQGGQRPHHALQRLLGRRRRGRSSSRRAVKSRGGGGARPAPPRGGVVGGDVPVQTKGCVPRPLGPPVQRRDAVSIPALSEDLGQGAEEGPPPPVAAAVGREDGG
mmetsp:Transcript_21345/g.62187  ORF Transcript_21345/g.62187 Transcript_21345/m.62187 type:complete len:243 (-) Transcript_21345:4870-5598(-)